MPIEWDWNYKMNNETIKYYIMEIIKNKEFGGERPLFATHDLQLENVTIHTGESALKECSNIIAVNCRFEGKYPFWHTNGFIVKNCLFTESGCVPEILQFTSRRLRECQPRYSPFSSESYTVTFSVFQKASFELITALRISTFLQYWKE